MVALMGMVLVSLASAGLVDFLSNSVSGSVVVEGPVFYIASGERLQLNELPTGYLGPDYTITGVDEKTFRTEENFGGIDFYKPVIKFFVDVIVNNRSSTYPRGLDLEFGYIDTSEDYKTICSVQYISIVDDSGIEIECPVPEEFLDDTDRIYFSDRAPNNIEEFYFTIDGMGSDSIKYTIKKKTSYVKIMGVYDE